MMSLHKKSLYNLYALHGFLGLTTDWNLFNNTVTHPIEVKNQGAGFWQWSQAFNNSIQKSDKKNILMGYSLGGRLAMHSLILNPAKWDAAIFISANPGITSKKEKAVRMDSDAQWAKRFLYEAWNPLMQDWNSNAVFGNKPFPYLREEKAFERKELANQLIHWSLGKQEPLIEHLAKLKMPMLFLAGELDRRFCAISDTFKKFAEVSIISEAAHRLPWDQPNIFINKIDNFIGGL